MLLGLYFFMVIALPLALGSYVLYNGLPRSRRCPSCADETIRLKSRGHDLAGAMARQDLHERWCMSCGWQGTVRLEREPLSTTSPSLAARSQGAAAGADRVDLRTLDVDGHSWRVMVECWAEDGRWLARLVFVAPGGQVCADQRSLEGKSVLEVLSQAFRLPEQTLAGRLRRSIR
jgi:hypothetical protein